MSTRGLYGFRKDGIDKLTFSPYDSFPDCLGKSIVNYVKKTPIKKMKEIFDKIGLIDADSIPSECEVVLNSYIGKLEIYNNGFVHMVDDKDFIYKSLFCEYCYIINLDTGKLEFWKGFQTTPDNTNRYGTVLKEGYYPCKLYETFDLKNIDINKTINRMVEIKHAPEIL
jgi:hypothetical protein